MERMELAKLNGTFDKDITIVKLIEKYGNECYLCNEKVTFEVPATTSKYPTIEHVTPISKGGTHSWDNVKVACRDCNVRKGVLTVEEFKNVKDEKEEIKNEVVNSLEFKESNLLSIREVAELFNGMTDKSIEKSTVAYYCEKLDIEFVRDSNNRKYLRESDIEKIKEVYYNPINEISDMPKNNNDDFNINIVEELKQQINSLTKQLENKDTQINSLISIIDKLS